ncbi:glycerophosphodiester phosphodiesterase [Azomonas macrocytogenes]|uniref:glycerophosphodiester phosphodiesterase n=1 Tax=Azomonas macrocytogenes TaxID=69962 RepID=A0A839T1N0_AZOMA|nr:glycerophosphoryl diester phosphodiesterase [Azomonas macrocytogenes]
MSTSIHVLRHGLLACSLIMPFAAQGETSASDTSVQSAIDWAGQKTPGRHKGKVPDQAAPLVVGHRGASGYVPEHTLASYALAILQGADYVEPDLVMTRDGKLVARHDNELGLTTDVKQHPEFADRKRTKEIDGKPLEGWFSEDFTLEEIKQLRAIERIPNIRPGNVRLDGAFEVPTFQEIIDLVKAMQLSEGRRIGIYIETKHPTHFQQLGLAMERPLVDTLKRNGYVTAKAPIYIQSFEVENLKTLNNLTPLRLVQLFDAGQPYDQQVKGTDLTYAKMATAEGLQNIARYAEGVGPEKSYVIPRDASGNLGSPTDFVPNAHAAGLTVHPFTFRAENNFLPTNLRSSEKLDERGDIDTEIRAFLDAGIDGLFIDQPDIAVRLRETISEQH